MTEKMGLAAVLDLTQFVPGLKSYMDGIASTTQANFEAAKSFVGFGKGLDETGDELDDTGDDAVKHAAKIEILEKAYDQARQTIEAGIGLAELGAAFERQERRFEAFSGGAEKAQANLEAFQQGAGGTVNKMEAMSSASRLLQMGLVQDAAEMEKVVEMATRLGDQTASAGTRVSDFALMLANTSIPRLDSYGISAGFVRNRMQELQTANEDMTREQAFSQAVFEAGADSLEILGDRADDNAAKMEKARARLEDYRIEMGQKVMPLVSKAAGAIAELDTATIALVTTLTSAVAVGAKFAGGLPSLISKLGMTTAQFGFVAVAGLAIVGTYEAVTNVQEKLAKGQKDVNDALKQWDSAAAQAVAEGKDLSTVIDDMAEGANIANVALHANAEGGNMFVDSLRDMGTAYVRMTSESEIMTGVAKEARDIIMLQAETFTEANKLIQEYNKTVENSEARIDRLSESTFRAVRAQEAFNEAVAVGDLEAAATALEDFSGIGRVFGQAMFKSAEAVAIVNEKVEEHKQVVEEAREASARATAQVTQGGADQVRALEEVESTWFDQQNAAIRGAQVQEEWNVKAEEATQRAEEMATALEEETQAQEDAAEAAEAHTLALLDQAEALSDADAAEAAKAAIAGLTDLYNEGALSLEEYDALVRDVQDDYGLVSEEGRALAEGMAILNKQLASGALSAEEYRTQLDALIESQVASIDATKAEADAQKELDKEFERAAKDAEREAERARDKAEREAEKLAEKIRRDVEREMEAAARAAEELPSRLFDALSKLGSTAMRTLKDEMKPLDEELGRIDDGLEIWKRALADPTADLQDQETALAKINELETERARVAAERAEQEEKILAFQEAQQQMQLLQQQLDLLELVQEHGLDAQNILGGLTADASASDIVEATTEAMQQIIEQMSGGLGGGAQSMTQAPVYAPPSTSNTSTSSQTNNFDMGGNNINNGMDIAQWEAMVRRVMAEAING